VGNINSPVSAFGDTSFDGDTKGDLIAELKLSHTIGGVGKLRSEQVSCPAASPSL
jgi:hypothetical protein